MKDRKNKEKPEEIEYGEFISSYFAWKTLEEQKETADKLANITNKENK